MAKDPDESLVLSLHSIMEDDDTNITVRLDAAQTLLAYYQKWTLRDQLIKVRNYVRENLVNTVAFADRVRAIRIVLL